MDIQTRNYRASQLLNLNRVPDEYAFTIQLTDGKGGKTNYMSITPEELNRIAKVLCGNYAFQQPQEAV